MLSEEQIPEAVPDRPTDLQDIGLPKGFLVDLTLKTIYRQGKMKGTVISEELKLPFGQVLRYILDHLEEEKYIEIKGGGQFADQWEYQITEGGRRRARELLEEDHYIGPAPVTIDQYEKITRQFAVSTERIDRGDLERAFEDLVVTPEYYDVFGPAVNSGRSVFVYGQPGNGKTAMCERIIDAFDDFVAIPEAIFVGGSVIRLFDPHYHTREPVPENTIDERWLITRRPFVSVGGELTMEELDLMYNPDVKFYEAPFQLKANTGILLIDDFGRQRMSPDELLNRWIVPLEKRIDFLTLHTGLRVEVPFELLVFYSTNLDPEQLVDEAFLRRLRYKIETQNPDEEEFLQLFESECERQDVAYDQSLVEYFITRHYHNEERDMRRCHPRDIIEVIVDFCRYNQEDPKLNREMLDRAADSYFADTVTWGA